MKNSKITLIFTGLMLMALFSGCALIKPVADDYVISINTSSDLNPDVDGRASPLVLRIYELRDDKLFAESDFFDLYDDDTEVLEKAIVEKMEIELNPNESRKLELSLTDETLFIGFLAAYRDIDSATWRELHNVKSQKPTGLPVFATRGLVIDLKKNKIEIQTASK